MISLVLTCEHAGNDISAEYTGYLPATSGILQTHRAYDVGIEAVFNELSGCTPHSFSHHVSRLLVDVNRSVGNAELFSEFTESLSLAEQEKLLAHHYFPYRNQVEQTIASLLQKNENCRVVHIALHSVTPVLRGKKRTALIGVLFDERRPAESEFAHILQENLQQTYRRASVALNYPYSGADDGLTTYLRRRFSKRYLGIELELNQRFCNRRDRFDGIKHAIAMSVNKLEPLSKTL